MIELLRPFEEFFHANLGQGWIRALLFQIFRFFHLYLDEFPDYFLFLVFAVPFYYLIPRTWRTYYLIIASSIMISVIYGTGFMMCFVFFPLLIHLSIRRHLARPDNDKRRNRRHCRFLYLSTLAMHGILLARQSFELVARIPFQDEPIFIPLIHVAGIAFILPKLLHYIVDSLNGKIEKTSLRAFLLYVLFFPIFRLGPIERFQNFFKSIRHVESNRIEAFDIGWGLFRIVVGVLKTVLYASILYPNRKFMVVNAEGVTWFQLYSSLFIAVIEAYFHFGGYCDIAIGLSRLLGFRISENFYFILFARNIGEFWRRWHITLSFWLRDYIYWPLGGSRSHAFRNGVITFFICGAWHSLAWNYILWGVLQAVGIAGLRAWGAFWKKVEKKEHFLPFLKPVLHWGRAHPRTSFALGCIATLHYFSMTGAYSLMEIERANFIMLRLFTFGWYASP